MFTSNWRKVSADLPVRRLNAADLPACLVLAADRNWTREKHKWQLLFEVSDVYGLDDPAGGGLAGAVVLTRYGPDLAAIGMMLVAARYGRRGLGSRLMIHALEQAAGAVVYLTATEFGRPLYQKLGFRAVDVSVTHRGLLRAGLTAAGTAAAGPAAAGTAAAGTAAAGTTAAGTAAAGTAAAMSHGRVRGGRGHGGCPRDGRDHFAADRHRSRPRVPGGLGCHGLRGTPAEYSDQPARFRRTGRRRRGAHHDHRFRGGLAERGHPGRRARRRGEPADREGADQRGGRRRDRAGPA